MARLGVKTDVLTSLYGLWHPDSYDAACGAGQVLQDEGLRARRATSMVAEASSSQQEPVTLFVSENCPTDLRKPDGISWCAKDFRIRRKLSSSKTCGVYLAEAVGSQTPVVLKIQSKERLSCMNRHQVAREVEVHSKMVHENILDMYGVFEDQYSLVMILEYASQGDVLKKLTSTTRGQLSEAEAKAVIVRLLHALAYVHDAGIIHRDIKPENILITQSGEIKLTDFGVCIDVAKERPVSAVGTLDYMSPEVTICPLKSAPSDNKQNSSIVYGCGTDIWGVGVLAFELVSGLPPFSAESSVETKQRIVNDCLRMPRHFSPALKSFVQVCTEKRASRRPSAEVLLNHAWLSDAPVAPASKSGLLKKAFSGKSLKPTIQSIVSNGAQQLSGPLSRSPPCTSPTASLPGLPLSPPKTAETLRPHRSLPPVELPSVTARDEISPTCPKNASPKPVTLTRSKSLRSRTVPRDYDHLMRNIGKVMNNNSKVESKLQPTSLRETSSALKAFKAGVRFSCA